VVEFASFSWTYYHYFIRPSTVISTNSPFALGYFYIWTHSWRVWQINLGVHYPTDCIAGCALGVLIILVSWGLRHGDRIACNACQNLACYANPADPLTTITYTVRVAFTFPLRSILMLHIRCINQTLSRVNWIMVGVVASCSILIGVLFIIPPIQFWTKFIRVYGYDTFYIYFVDSGQL
jgi:hypothetical protein